MKLDREELERRVAELEAENAALYRAIKGMTTRLAHRNAIAKQALSKLSRAPGPRLTSHGRPSRWPA